MGVLLFLFFGISFSAVFFCLYDKLFFDGRYTKYVSIIAGFLWGVLLLIMNKSIAEAAIGTVIVWWKYLIIGVGASSIMFQVDRFTIFTLGAQLSIFLLIKIYQATRPTNSSKFGMTLILQMTILAFVAMSGNGITLMMSLIALDLMALFEASFAEITVGNIVLRTSQYLAVAAMWILIQSEFQIESFYQLNDLVSAETIVSKKLAMAYFFLFMVIILRLRNQLFYPDREELGDHPLMSLYQEISFVSFPLAIIFYRLSPLFDLFQNHSPLITMILGCYLLLGVISLSLLSSYFAVFVRIAGVFSLLAFVAAINVLPTLSPQIFASGLLITMFLAYTHYASNNRLLAKLDIKTFLVFYVIATIIGIFPFTFSHELSTLITAILKNDGLGQGNIIILGFSWFIFSFAIVGRFLGELLIGRSFNPQLKSTNWPFSLEEQILTALYFVLSIAQIFITYHSLSENSVVANFLIINQEESSATRTLIPITSISLVALLAAFAAFLYHKKLKEGSSIAIKFEQLLLSHSFKMRRSNELGLFTSYSTKAAIEFCVWPLVLLKKMLEMPQVLLADGWRMLRIFLLSRRRSDLLQNITLVLMIILVLLLVALLGGR
ncbi:MAG: hypothetical protein A2504_05780 [Bdellovibrionales bacterium RIFOXYD12_FULL_39_22]|nr:MAG: hypothetical protein A2385_06045 [Bdellovibrionales bacterium RIFOXYB1_FULL_39_21]OFZ41841.1 MAG: hypothetical protein A2485_08015 [Bdellovibrionales bacterium RIFOXYC12_FULL_39_17]OFZ50557.1 MAG: hypothetical protein A2404_04965 [Bdellovibrionales bacterium RIFOXYC1_FULL_39_130]OFZ75270.1 MAG: hypothetical protein A2451_12965 [Bdellovibrionales bacterium RIFOXYC2_FULL_39_8]OFZ77780.1 MAG: hypothetical protein A2560_00135 [Bdellovibrionales bacterium RIFOXYD1_FULL_39_84]OFZ93784.1 MAG: